MPSAIIGKKLGMTQRFADDGSVVPLTVVQAGPCVVVQRKTQERDGYEAIQLGLVEPGRRVQVTKPKEGHFKKAGVAPCQGASRVQARSPSIRVRLKREIAGRRCDQSVRFQSERQGSRSAE